MSYEFKLVGAIVLFMTLTGYYMDAMFNLFTGDYLPVIIAVCALYGAFLCFVCTWVFQPHMNE